MEGPNEPGDLTSLQVRRAISGDLEGLAWVVKRLSPLLRAQAEYRMGPRLRAQYDPEDLVQDVWAVALSRLGELPAREGRYTPVLLRFLSTTLLYRLNNLVRKQIRAARGSPAGPAEEEVPARPLDQLPDPTSGVITGAARRELQTTVLAGLAELEEGDRAIVVLRGIEQNPNQTVALLLGLEPAAVAVKYHRALKKLRDKLPDSVFDELE